MKPVEIGVGFFGGGGEQLPVKKTTRKLQTGKGMVFFLYGLFSYCRLNQEVLLRWLMEAVMEVVVVVYSSDRRPTVYGMRPGYYKQSLMNG